MKKIAIFLVAAFIILSAGGLSAQSFKFGHINLQELIQVMPDLQEAQKKLQAYEKDLQEMIQETNAEYQKKMKDFEEKQSTWSEAVKNAKQRDLVDAGRRVQEQATNAQQDYAKESEKLFQPIETKAREAIAKVAKSNGFTYIFDLSRDAVVYFNEAQSTDIMPLVKKELQIK